MGLQEIIVAALFLVAIIYTARVIYRNLKPQSNCASGCGKCGVDFSHIKAPKS
ncbi:MAG TPA: FeoB-associated Cys-rich membrane protein [Sphingobacteriaceae bacterium]